MRESHLQHGCAAGGGPDAAGSVPGPAPDGDDDAAVTVPRKGARLQVRQKLPLIEESSDQARK
jgi:hypothetical protein